MIISMMPKWLFACPVIIVAYIVKQGMIILASIVRHLSFAHQTQLFAHVMLGTMMMAVHRFVCPAITLVLLAMGIWRAIAKLVASQEPSRMTLVLVVKGTMIWEQVWRIVKVMI
jgi:hypothetical protein